MILLLKKITEVTDKKCFWVTFLFVKGMGVVNKLLTLF